MSEAAAAAELPAVRIDGFEEGAIETAFFHVGDVLVFTGRAADQLRNGDESAEGLLRMAARAPLTAFLVRSGQVARIRFERGTVGLTLGKCAPPEAVETVGEPGPWIDIFRDERDYHPLLAEARSALALAAPVIYFYAAGAWRQVVTVLCFYLVALAVHPLFFIGTYLLWSVTAWRSGPELVAADFRYYERRLWARMACAPAQRASFFTPASTGATPSVAA